MNLERALAVGEILDDLREIAVHVPAPTGLATYRGIVRCLCGTPVLLHIEAVWQNQELTVLRAAIGGENCPDCGNVLSPAAVTYAGIYSAGWPLVPATSISSADLYHAMALMEMQNR